MAAPLDLRLSARHPRTLVGEGILFDLAVRVAAALEMDTPELNRDRTSIHIQSAGGKTRTLTGADYMRLHHVHPLSQVGQMMPVAAGQQWTVEVNLFHYTTALPAGSYAVSLAYRYGKTAAESVSTNAVNIEVAPAKLSSVSYRWLGGAQPRETLASVWAAADGAQEQWFYQIANRRNPAAVETAVRIGQPARHPGAKPMVAHLNDIQSMHFKKFVVWEQDGEFGAIQVHTAGRAGEARFLKHGLQAGARLVDPPLQLHHGGLLALLTGLRPDGTPGCSLVSLPEAGAGDAKVSPITAVPEEAAVLWPADERVPGLFLRLPGGHVTRAGAKANDLFAGRVIDHIALSQWMGTGTFTGIFHEGGRILTFSIDSQKAADTLQARTSYEVAKLPAQPGRFISSAFREPGGVTLLFEAPTGWIVLDGGQAYALPRLPGVDAPPILIPAGKALYMVQHHPERGFVSQLIGTPPPESLI
jgi:hypothetical protein